MILSFLKKHYLTIAIFLFGFFILFRPPTDPDFGWHYKYGEYIFKNHSLLKENIFSYTFADYKWANSYWLSELYLYIITHFLSAQFLAVLNSVIFSLVIVWLVGKSRAGPLIKIIGLLPLFALISDFAIVVRPMFFSSLFLLLITYLLLYKPKSVKYFPLIFLLWANLHADYVPGLAIYGIYSLIDLINSFREKKFNLTRNILIPLASVFATFINPYTTSLWTTLIKERDNVTFSNISEFLPAPVETTLDFLLLLYVYSGLMLSSLIMYKNRHNIWYSIVLVVFFLLSLRFIYFFRVFAIVGIFGFCNCWGFIIENILPIYKWLFSVKIVIFAKTILLICVLFSVIIFGSYLYKSLSLERWSVAAEMPYGAINYIKENKPKGNMFNNYSWGGYLIWQLPEYKTFIDGRMPSWRENGDFLFKDYVDITRNPEKSYTLFNKYYEEHNIGWVLDKKDSKLLKFLINRGDWKEAYSDKYSEILIKNP